ncbi:mitochondrial ribosomal protein subunit S8 [Gymnopus androsaceus JB14]|uniref:Mitochondrial ribosomal protein subunit S8 n=1 Tax=Gymnopus androsaceus JB14 TaxID=1447944 RepID=A0A6A4H464_9AGAR|nr:mitochondrial ribosomal protein subunit S8 [Gymnopus androsaceus JB14]
MLPHALCSRIQNAFRARHAQIGVEHTTQNLGILSILLRAGFISNLTRGTIEGADPDAFNRIALQATRSQLSSPQTINSLSTSLHSAESQLRIWATLKYRDDLPVLRYMSLVSKPSNRVYMDLPELRRICSGGRAGQIPSLGLGEIAVVKTKEKEYQWLEAREVICRAG